MENNTKQLTARCCIAGGGPAGMMLGYLLARAGVDVVVLEKHKDFFRDFRGDTIHPSTFQIMAELGLLDEFLKVPHQEVKLLAAQFNEVEVPIADFTHLPVAHPVLGIMPQWDFLNFLATEGKKYAGFHLVMEAGVTGLVKEGGRVTGVTAQTPDGLLEVKAGLVVGTDGRGSVVREKAGLHVITTGAPIDVLWFRLSSRDGDPPAAFGRFYNGRIMVLIERGDYWQCGYVIEKDGYDEIKKKGLDAFRKELRDVSPFLGDRVTELKDWNDISLLRVTIDHLEKWCGDGVLCIGDAAHAMSPVGGVGINLAVQDAVASANILYTSLLTDGPVAVSVLKKVQQRRAFPTWVIQRMQVFIQNGVITRHRQQDQAKMPVFFKMLQKWPLLRRIPARIVGMGVRPEHIKTPDCNLK